MDREEVDILHPLTSLEWGRCRRPPVPFISDAQSVCLNGKVYVRTGGWPGSARASARLYIYTPASDTWDKMDTPVYDFALTVYHSQLVLVGGKEYVDEYSIGRLSTKVWTLGEDGQWQTTLLIPLEVPCFDASAVSHGDHLFVIDTLEGVFIYNGRYWARAQRPTFLTVPSFISSTVIDGCWYVMSSNGEVHYASLDSLIASTGPSQTPQPSSVWKRLPDTAVGLCSPAKFGNRLIAVGGRAIYAFSRITQSWVEVVDAFHTSSAPCGSAVVLPSNELMITDNLNTYKVTLKVTPFDLQSHFNMRALSLLEAAGIPLMSSLGDYTGSITHILGMPLAIAPPPIESLLRIWLQSFSMTAYPPTWNSLLQITCLLNLHDLAERIETCLKTTTVDHHVVCTGSGEEMSLQDKIVYQLKQENASLRGNVELLKSENEQLRIQSLPVKKEVKTELKEEAFMMTKAEPTSDKLTATGVEYESQLHSQDEVIYQLKQKVDSLIEERDNAIFELKSATELLRGQFKYYPEPIKEEVEEKPLALIPVKTELKEEAVTMSKAEPSSDKAVAMASWDLPGVEVCREMSVVVHSSRYQPITWEGFGLRLHIQEDSLPAGMEQCTLNIKASLAGQYEFPENSSLVSAVFWLHCEPTCKFTKPVTVEIQHCAKSENVDSLKMKFVRALCSQAQLPYTFKELGGDFNRHSSYGVIQVNGFSGLAVTQEGSEEREYCSQLFYLGQPSSCQIHFVVTWNIEAHLTAVQEEYRRKNGAATPSLHKLVDFESDAITLDIPVEGITIKGWEIVPLVPPVVTKKQVDNFREGKSTPCCQLLAEMSKRRKKITSIKHRITLNGSKQQGDFILINLPQGGSPTMEREQTFGDLAAAAIDLGPPPNKRSRQESDQSTTEPTLSSASGSAKPELKDLLKELYNKVSHSWKAIGIMLGLDPGVLDTIKATENNVSQNCLREMLTVWTKQVEPPPSWSAIAEAIECLGDEQLADHLRTKYVPSSSTQHFKEN